MFLTCKIGGCFSLIPQNYLSQRIDIAVKVVYYHIQKRGCVMQAYCVKCRAKREMKDPQVIKMKNGRPATKGVCPVCGTKMFRIGKS
jgi:NAD-dependent SIR2 family protein deacetylase